MTLFDIIFLVALGVTALANAKGGLPGWQVLIGILCICLKGTILAVFAWVAFLVVTFLVGREMRGNA
jgi:hypothetical protein